jgi:predicted glycosyltransferase
MSPLRPHRPARAVPPRLLFISNEILGLGHLRIALRLSAAIRSELPDAAILVLTAASMIHAFPLPDGVEVVKIPGVLRAFGKPGAYRPARLPVPVDDVRKLRERIILETARTFRPDICLVDYRPGGIGGELLPMLRILRRRGAATILVLRDILDDPALVHERWRVDRGMVALKTLYDEIWVYGCQALYDPVKEYRFPAAVARKVRFCGYLDVEPPGGSADEIRRSLGVGNGRLVLVTVGNGRVGFPLLEAYLGALEYLPRDLDLFSLIVAGPELPAAQRAVIRQRCDAAGSRRVTMVDFLSGFLDYMSAADLVVALGGYNTMSEVVSLGKRAVVVPYADEHQEQVLRAALLDRLGVIRTVAPDQLSADGLADALVAAFRDTPSSREHLRELGFEFGGLRCMTAHVARLLGRGLPSGRPPGQKIAIGCAGAPVAPRRRSGVALKRNS